MAYELTLEGLFYYFELVDLQQIIELPLIKKHLSVHHYFQIKKAFADFQQSQKIPSKVEVDPYHAILDLEILKKAGAAEVQEYLQHPKIRDIYVQCYGDYFLKFESQHRLFQAERIKSSLDLGQEQILLLHIQAAMALPLQAFTNALLEQDVLLQEIATLVIYQASQAEKIICCIKSDDATYKQTVVNLAFSMVKMSLGYLNAGELINIGHYLAKLAASSLDKVDQKLASLVSDIQNLVVHTHMKVLQDAEKELLSVTAPEDITLRWSNYRAHIFLSATRSIQRVLDTCVNNDDFFRCVIKETLAKNPKVTQEAILIHATKQARNYLAEINAALNDQVKKIHHIRDVIKSSEGGLKVELYFRKIGLINYVNDLLKNKSMIQNWLTKKLGHRLAFYFPDIVFQKKWTSSQLSYFIFHEISYARETLTLKEYQARRKNAAVVLGLFSNSTTVKQNLYSSLEEQKVRLHDELITALQNQPAPELLEDILLEEPQHSYRANVYLFQRRRLSLFSFTPPASRTESSKTLEEASSPVRLVSRRALTDDSSID